MMKLPAGISNRISRKVSHRARSRKSRVSQFEQLEARRVLAAAVWNNVGHPTNVDGDEAGIVSPIDALLVINELNSRVYSDSSSGALPKQFDAPLPGHFYDVSCDNFVSPIDALLVINHINQNADTGGLNGTGVYPSLACSPQLEEGSGFVAEFAQTLTLPDDSSAVKIHFRAPEFDTSSKRTIRDAFEIEITDLDGNLVTLPYVPGRDAVYNWSEDLEPQFGVGAETTTSMSQDEDSSATVNLSGMEAGTRVRVTARLVNNDLDDGTSVILRGFEIVDVQTPAPNGAAGARERIASVAPVNLADLTDVTSSFAPSYGRTTLSGDNNELNTELVVTNLGSQAVTGRIVVAIDNISVLDAAAMHPDGLLRDGRPFFDLTAEMDEQPLGPGESVRSRELSFLNDSGNRFTYKLSTYGSLNAAPSGFVSTPVTKIEAGRNYVYTAEATDPDQQALSYSIVTGPEDLAINTETGEVTWSTEAGDIGSYNIIIRATDPHGLFVEQSYTLEVIASLQNRPPQFVSDPVTDAIASSGFEITTVATGAQPAGVDVISGFRGPRLVSANSGDQTIGVYAGENNDRFDDTTSYSTGFPTSEGQLFDVGYAVDVGLPELLTASDSNAVKGMDQGDLNGDGILDFVVLTQYDLPSSGERYQFVISALIGDADGNFRSPLELYRHSVGTNSYNPRNLLLRDINNDGALDVLVVDTSNDPRLITVLGNDDGTFADPVEQRFESTLTDFWTADIDEDGVLDLIGRTADFGFGGAAYDAAWLRGQGDGTFGEPIVIADAATDGNTATTQRYRPHDVADLNGDGNLDFVFTTSAGISIYHSDGAGNFSIATQFNPSSTRTQDWIRAGDFNGDGLMDLVHHSQSNRRIDVLVGDGSGIDFVLQQGAAEQSIGVVKNSSGSGDPTDIDNDGDLDLIFAEAFNNFASPQVAINDGSGNFTIIEYAMVDFSQSNSQLRFDPDDIARGGMFGDYNSDGVFDFSYFTDGGDANGVGIRLGTRPGEFGNTRTIPWTVNRRSQDATPGDFNGDGIVDLVDTANDRVSLGIGNGSFDEAIPAFGVLGSGYASVADFNLDGIDDVVAARSNRYFVGLANGDGTFTVSDDQLIGNSFYGYTSTQVGDFNADGYPDFVAKAGVETHIDVHLNDPDNPGVFSRSFRVTLPAGSQGINVSNWQESYAVADFTGDGILDLSFAERDNDGDGITKVVIMAGDGAGDFSRHSELAGFDEFAEVISAPFYEPGDFSYGDIDSDGDVDLISNTSYGARIFLNDGTGEFEFLTHLETPGAQQRGRDSWLVDFNEDTHLDFVQTGSWGYGPIVIRLGNGDATFQEAHSVGLISAVSSVVSRQPFVDLDGDGHLDFVFAIGGAGNYINYSVSNFAGRRDDLVDLISVDLNGDGNEEVLAVQEQMDRLQVFVGDNLGGFTRQPDLQTGRAPQAVATTDLNGDGQLELLIANRASRSLSVFSGDLGSGFTSAEFPVGIGIIDVASADFNQDGHEDVLVLDETENALWMFTGDGTLVLGAPAAIALGDTPASFTLADTDGDNLVDVVVTLPETNRVMILPGDGSGGFGQPSYVNLEAAPSDVAVVDLNDDGFPELAATLPELHVLSVAYGLGNSQFSRTQQIQVGQSPEKVTLTDADEDGRLDLVVANRGDDTVSVIYNRFDPNEVYRYDSDAIDPDNDTLTYSITDGPGGLIINASSGELLWAASPDQVGAHDVTIAADDGRGGVATQSFKIEVEPARENSSPLIATEPTEKIGAGESFTYQATAIDGDDNALRYRLLDAPDGATIDPVTGMVDWDARMDGTGFLSPDGVSNGSFVNAGDIVTPVGASGSLALNTLTVEGWFNPENLTASNGAATLFRYGGNSEPFHVRLRFNNELELFLDQDGTTSQQISRVPFDVEIGRWYHIALTIDDANQTYGLMVDGQSVMSGDLPSSFVYDDRMNLEIGGAFWDFSGQVDNFRIWNTARTPEQIRDGLTRQFDNDPNLVLDYRFEVDGARIVRDNTPNRNDGYLTPNVGTPEVAAGGLAEAGTHSFTIGVEDGRGGYDEQSFSVEVLPELRGSIVGHLFDDLNGNGDQDDGSEEGVPAEPNLEGWHLWIDSNGNSYPDPHEPQATTDADGNYEFAGLLPASYTVRVSPVAGFVTPAEFEATVEPEINREIDPSSVTDYDLAIEQLSLSHIRGQLATEDGDAIAYWKAYADLNGDGQRGDDEPMAVSDRNGNYALTGLDAGTYTIRTELPAGWADSAGREGLEVTLAADEIAADNDFILEPTNTSVTGGVHFVTMPSTTVEARDTFTYASIAMGISDAEIVYDLSLAPEGMVIDPSTGLVAWRPTIDQVGEHLVILRATDASGSISLHDFTLDVSAPNTAPVIVLPAASADGSQGSELHLATEPFLNAYVGLNYSHDVIAQDAESTSLSYSLTAAPSGATIDADSGRIRWTPAAGDVGSQDFTVEVIDADGASTSETWSVSVRNESPAALPLNVTLPRSTAAVTADYFSRISARDALGRPVTWVLTSAPTGLTIASDGTIEWTPSADQLGTQTLELVAATADGETETVTFDIDVTGRSLNAIPSIDSEPVTSVSLGQTFAYEVLVADTDRDIHAFTLLEGPIGMSVHPSLGFVSWTPAEDQLGEHDVLIQVSDPSGDTAEQSFTLAVSRFGGPPRIVSIPPTEASAGVGFLYSVEAVDREGDPLTYSLLAAPAGMTIVETTGELSWTPTADQVGDQDVVIQVSDGIGGATTQAFVVKVSAGAPNLPPAITTTAPRFGAVGTEYSYTLAATDPENTAITYSISRGPVGMSIDSSTGEVMWTPAAGDEGKIVVTFVATDEGGATAVESFELDVLAQNSRPTINSTAPTESTAGALFMYDVLARDVDLDALSFELTESPAGAEIDAFGRIRWQTAMGDEGDYDFTVKVRDPRGGEAMQSFTLQLLEDTEGPKVSLIERPNEASRNVLPWQGPFIVYAKAIDNVEVASLTLTANGQDIPLDAAGTATFAFEDWFFNTINATATAIDTSGNVTQRTVTFNYDVPEGWSTNPGPEVPTAIITSPTDNGTAFGMVSITGTADHEDFGAYTLSYRRADETSFTEFHRSTTAVVDGELGVWDTSLLRNDEYVIRLQVATTEGTANVVEHSVGLSGELKLGNFQLSFTDMVIPVAGIPIEITRIYDTLQADVEGDFGYGWRLEYRNTDLRVGLPSSGLEDIGIYSALRPGVKVYLNVPGEGRQGFTFNPNIRVLPGWGGNNLVLARPRFTPDPGVTSTLSTGISNYLQVNEQGELFAPGGIPYNPASPDFGGAYVLTTREGSSYRIDGATGKLSRASNREGNNISFTEDGIRAGDGSLIVSIRRDTNDRITNVLDAEGNSVRFSYSNEKLVSVVDREDNEVRYRYSNATGLLEEVVDPLGRLGTRSEYDEDGRLARVFDVNGNAIEIDHSVETSSQTIRNRLGQPTTYVYDNAGNLRQEIDALGGVIRRQYDDLGNVQQEVDQTGVTTSYRYDSRGLLLSDTDGAGGTRRYEYSSDGQIIGFIDPAGNRSSISYLNGRPVSISDPLGTRTFSEEGSAITETDATGRSTTIDFNQNGLIRSISDGLSESQFLTDTNGNVLSDSQIAGEETYTTEFTWDREGRQIQTTDALGNTTTNVFDAVGNRLSTTNALGHRTEYRYDAANNLVETIFPDNTPEDLSDNPRFRAEYDTNDRLTREIDEAGRATEYFYDALDRLIETVFPDDTPEDDSDNPRFRREYDAAGRLIAEINENGVRSEFEYDTAGRLKVIRDGMGGEAKRTYDVLGNVVRTADQNGNLTNYSYDAAGNLVQTEFADGATVSAVYDAAGRKIADVDQKGRATHYRYNPSGQLDRIVEADGRVTEYLFDELGNVEAVVDANGNRSHLEFDSNSRLLAEIDPLGQRTTYAYDAIGRVASITDANGTVMTFEYDPRDRLTAERRPDGDLQFTYTPTGLLETFTDDSGTYSQQWDSRDRLISKTTPSGESITYRYDAVGNITEIRTFAGERQYSFDELNRISSVSDPNGGTTNYTYDAFGNLVTIAYPNGLIESRVFDVMNRLVESQTAGPQGEVASSTYTFDETSRLTSQAQDNGRVTTYEYDSLGRLTAEHAVGGNLQASHTTYEYDAEGNRLVRRSGSVITRYEYDSNDRLTREVIGSDITEYEYDLNGNLIRETRSGSATSVTRYHWDSRNLLLGIDTNNDGTLDIQYNYDPLGNLVEVIRDGESIEYVVDSNRELEQVLDEVSDSDRTHYTYGNGIVFTSNEIGDYYHHADIRGNVVQLSSTDGTIVADYAYDAFGEIQGTTQLLVANLFLGERVSDAGMYYLRARNYDVSTGRFVSKDPFPADLEDSLSFNRYVYAQSDPINNNDPTGLVSLKGVLITVGINLAISGAITLKTGGSAKDFAQDFAIGMLMGGVFKGIAVGVKAARGLYVAKAVGTTGTSIAGAATSQAAKEATKASVKLANYLVRRTILRTSTNHKLLARGVNIIKNSRSPAEAVRQLTGGVGTNRFNAFIETRWIANKISPEVWRQLPKRMRQVGAEAAERLNLPPSYVDNLIEYLNFVRPFS